MDLYVFVWWGITKEWKITNHQLENLKQRYFKIMLLTKSNKFQKIAWLRKRNTSVGLVDSKFFQNS